MEIVAFSNIERHMQQTFLLLRKKKLYLKIHFHFSFISIRTQTWPWNNRAATEEQLNGWRLFYKHFCYFFFSVFLFPISLLSISFSALLNSFYKRFFVVARDCGEYRHCIGCYSTWRNYLIEREREQEVHVNVQHVCSK